MIVTRQVKLLPSAEQQTLLLETIDRFNKACNYISKLAWEKKEFKQFNLHHLYYFDCKSRFALPAQMVVRALARVANSYKTDKRHPHKFSSKGMEYDQKNLTFKGWFLVSLSTLSGRVKVPLISHWDLSKAKMRGQVELIFKNGKFLLLIPVEVEEEEEVKPRGVIGVDLGIVNLATTSEGVTYSGARVDRTRKRMAKHRAALQRRGSKSAKRHLKRLSGRERRFKRDTNHVIAKLIVSAAKDTRRGIALEELNGLRVTVTKKQRERFGKWAFDELGRFIEYKAKLVGVPVFWVPSAYTSQRCSVCGHVNKKNRVSQSKFVCQVCGHTANADINAAINIASRAPVNEPIVAGHHVLHLAPSYKPTALAVGS